MIEIAEANLPYPSKDEDACLVRSVDGAEMVKLLAVADGLSMSGGRLAAQTIIRILNQVDSLDSARSIFEQMSLLLSNERDDYPESETTITCGLLKCVHTQGDAYLRFDFFAIGDSPIWKVVRAPKGSRFPFQRYLVHGTPYPSETAKVYSTVRLPQRDVNGPVTFGTIEISSNEVLVICTDGIPERDVFFRDHNNRSDLTSNKATGLCNWMFQDERYNDEGIEAVLNDYCRRDLLYDDATIIVARVHVPKATISLEEELDDSGNEPFKYGQINASMQLEEPCVQESQSIGAKICKTDSFGEGSQLAQPKEVVPEPLKKAENNKNTPSGRTQFIASVDAVENSSGFPQTEKLDEPSQPMDAMLSNEFCMDLNGGNPTLNCHNDICTLNNSDLDTLDPQLADKLQNEDLIGNNDKSIIENYNAPDDSLLNEQNIDQTKNAGEVESLEGSVAFHNELTDTPNMASEADNLVDNISAEADVIMGDSQLEKIDNNSNGNKKADQIESKDLCTDKKMCQ